MERQVLQQLALHAFKVGESTDITLLIAPVGRDYRNQQALHRIELHCSEDKDAFQTLTHSGSISIFRHFNLSLHILKTFYTAFHLLLMIYRDDYTLCGSYIVKSGPYPPPDDSIFSVNVIPSHGSPHERQESPRDLERKVYTKEHIDIPLKDIFSWYYEDSKLDPDEPIYIDASNDSRYYTLKSAKKTIRQLVAGFRHLGIQKGDVVCVHSFNDINYPILVNGIVAAGAIFSGTNPAYLKHELTHAFRSAGVKYVVTEPELLQTVLQTAENVGLPRENILIFDHYKEQKVPAGFSSWQSLLSHGEEDWVSLDKPEDCKTTIVARLFSSGTTGLPKVAVLSHYNFIAQHRQVIDWKPKPYTQRRLIANPMFHVATVPSIHFSPLRSGIRQYLLRRFELKSYLECMEKYKITEMATVPPMVIDMINSDLMHKYDLSSVKGILCGAAPLEKGPQARLQALVNKDAPFTQVWGMTETTCIVTNFPWPESDTTGSIGRPVPGIDIKLVDDNGRDITAYGVRGEICIRGPTVIPGYLDAKATSDSWDSDGFFHTGDICYCEEETGKWYIVDRKKELIKVRGFQVAPPELEGVLLSHENINDAAVIGVNIPGTNSELPRAYIVRRPGIKEQDLTVDMVKQHMAERLSKFKRLDGGVVFLPEIPKSPSGKILKRVLREMAAKEIKEEAKKSKL